MTSKNFARKWSIRFLRYSGAKIPKPHTLNKWCREFSKDTAHCNWVRLVIYTWNQKSFNHMEDVEPVISWLESACMHPSFVKTRAHLDFNAGLQVWFSHQEDVIAFTVCAADAIRGQRHLVHADAMINLRESFTPFQPVHIIQRP